MTLGRIGRIAILVSVAVLLFALVSPGGGPSLTPKAAPRSSATERHCIPVGGMLMTDATGKIYAIGGSGNLGIENTVEVYDPTTKAWMLAASMPTARYGLTAASVNGKIYAIGGDIGNLALNTVEMYDPATNTWTAVAPMSTAKAYLAVTDATGFVYAIGGTPPTSQI